MMDGDRKRPKGGLFHLFDWNLKSRKKLFLNNNGFPEVRQRNEIVEGSSESLIYAMEAGNKGANSTRSGSSDISCSDERYEIRAPGVIARLMGLDSFPLSNVLERSFTPFSDSDLLRTPQVNRASPNLSSDYDIMKNLNSHCEQERDCWKSVASMSHKKHSQPFERFQADILPPKSAKRIPVAHNKLSSPISSPGFNPAKNATCVMKTAAKILDASPRAATGGRISLIRSPSVPLRIQDLKQKMEAAQRASRQQKVDQLSNMKSARGHTVDKKQNGSENNMYPEGNSSNLKNKGNFVSPVVQVKANIQRREGSTSTSYNINKQKVQHDIKSFQLVKQQKNIQKRTSENMANNVLRQNSQKQNTLIGKKNSFSNRQQKKFKPVDGSIGPDKSVNKVVIKPESVSRSNVSRDRDAEKEKANIPYRKKQLVNRDFRIDTNLSDKFSFDEVEMPTKGNVTRGGNMAATYNAKHRTDVVSFTFTSPIAKAMPGLQPHGQVAGESNISDTDAVVTSDPFYSKYLMSSMPQMNITCGEGLGFPLEEKLKELTNRIESSHFNIIREESYASSKHNSENLEPRLDMVTTKHKKQDTVFHLILDEDESDLSGDLDCFPVKDQQHVICQNWQLSEEVEIQSDEAEECSCSNHSETEKEFECLDPSPASTLKPSFISGCCTNANGILFSLSPEAGEVLNATSINESLAEGKIDFSNSASSICRVDVERKDVHRAPSRPATKYSNSLELAYVREVFGHVEPLLEDLMLGQAISPKLFEWMEYQENQMQRNEEEISKLGRKMLFDCICEHLDLMCGQVLGGSNKAWTKLRKLVERKGRLANQLCKEILGWKSMGDMMVDELVDKDMSTGRGSWLDFDVEAFEQVLEIEEGLLTSLLQDLVFDLVS